MTPQDVEIIKDLVGHVVSSFFGPALVLLVLHHGLVYLREP